MQDSSYKMALENAIFRMKLRQALGLGGTETADEVDPEQYGLMLKKKRIASILKEQMRAAGMDELADMTRVRRE